MARNLGCAAVERQRPPTYRGPMARQSSFPILFITATRIGDAVLSSGLIARLADEIPNARFTIVAGPAAAPLFAEVRSEEHTSELQSLMRISYAVFCLKKTKHTTT